MDNHELKTAYTVGGFHAKGWTKFFSAHIFNFWGQNSVFYGSERLQTIFWVKFAQVKM
jgi:hypothetical protein